MLNLILILAGIAALFIFLRRPESPITLLYPLIWLFWAYRFPGVGRMERVIGLLAIAGLFLLAGKRQSFPRLPLPVLFGPVLLIAAYLVSGLVNSSSNPWEVPISMATRALFLYLAFFLLAEPQRLRLTGNLFILSGLIGGALILYWSSIWGMGFMRDFGTDSAARASLGPFWYSLTGGGNFLTFPAVLLMQKYSNAKQRIYPLLGAGFLFTTAFLAQFRREILFTFVLLLLYLLVTNLNGLRKLAFWLLLAGGIFYALVLQPSALFRVRMAETAQVVSGTDVRLMNFQAGLKSFLASPLSGAGPSNYSIAVERYLGSSRQNIYYGTYNAFIFFAVEAGIFALGGFLLTLYGVLRQISLSKVDPDTPQGWILGSAPMLMIIVLIWFIFGNASDLSLPWYIMGMIMAAASLSMEGSPPQQESADMPPKKATRFGRLDTRRRNWKRQPERHRL